MFAVCNYTFLIRLIPRVSTHKDKDQFTRPEHSITIDRTKGRKRKRERERERIVIIATNVNRCRFFLLLLSKNPASRSSIFKPISVTFLLSTDHREHSRIKKRAKRRLNDKYIHTYTHTHIYIYIYTHKYLPDAPV